MSILCNHQRSVPKAFAENFKKLQKRADLLDRQIKELKKMGRLARRNEVQKIKLKPSLPADATREQKQAVAHLYVQHKIFFYQL